MMYCNISVNDFCGIIEELIGEKVSINKKLIFTTDEECSLLPKDINRWLQILYSAGIELPKNCKIADKKKLY